MSSTMTETQQYKALQGQFNIDEAQGVVECFVAGIGNKDSVGDIIVPGAFTDSLKRRKPRVVWGHNWNEPIGKVLEMYEVPPSDPRLPMKMRAAGIGGLYAKVQFNLKSERGRQAFADVAFFGEEQEWSIGYKTLDADFDPQRQANVLKKVELYEASPVLHGANQLTGTISIKSVDNATTDSDEVKGGMRDESGKLTDQGRSFLSRLLASNLQRQKPQVQEKPEQEDDAIDAPMPSRSREANLPLALAKKFGGAVRIRESDANSAIFDHRVEGQGIITMRVSYHYEDGQFMIGEATRVKPQVVYINVDGDKPSGSDAERRYEDRYNLDADPQVPAGVKPKSPEKADPLGGIIPQEIVTARTRGYGPRRGNLEKLLRYWRPIMKKPGGFRRCRVILANHPELYPLNNICAWLHHETTGLWPNEGCHHPGMKNCRGKLRKLNWDDNEFNNRLRGVLKPGKSLETMTEEEIKSIFDFLDSEEKGYEMMEAMADRLAESDETEETMKMEDVEFENEDEGNEKAYEALKQFMNDEPDFINYMADKKNWVMEGDDDNGGVMEMPYYKDSDDDDDCGCGGGGKDPKQMMGMLMAAIAELMGKDADEDIEVKAGRVISSRNMTKLQNAFNLLKEVLSSGGVASEIEAKSLSLDEKETLMVSSAERSLYEVKELLDPILDYYQIKSEVTEDGVIVEIDGVEDEAFDALLNIMDSM
jgi:HK97 family phage prohead protease